ncbi:MAG: glycosyltransferase family 2 protein [Candidatus Bathyarchaeia archaeon]
MPNTSPHLNRPEHNRLSLQGRTNSVTSIIITKNRPQKVKRLVKSLIAAELDSISIVLIDDSDADNFLQTKSFFQSHSLPFIQLSSLQAGKLVGEILNEANLTESDKNFIRNCTGINSPFCGYVERFLELVKEPKPTPTGRYLQFAPYSAARNLGICCAVKFFKPESIFFLDDDCVILHPTKMKSQIQLIGAKLNRKNIVAVAGLYRDISDYSHFEQRIFEKFLRILRGMDVFLRKCFAVGKERFVIMPLHILGGVLLLDKRAFYVLPFDPYVARGEDHAYALDLKAFLDKNEIAIRDNHFIVGHQKEEVPSPKHMEMNVLRDIFRFVYIHRKARRSFISFFVFRWLLASLVSLLFNPPNYKQYTNELWALMFVAPHYTKKNAYAFKQGVSAWNDFLRQLGT